MTDSLSAKLRKRGTDGLPAGSDSPTGAVPSDTRHRRSVEASKLKAQTGWPWDTRELAHFYARPLSYSRIHTRWRKDLIEKIADGRFEGVLSAPRHTNVEGKDTEARDFRKSVKSAVDAVTERLREISRILAIQHQAPETLESSDSHVERLLIRLAPFQELGLESQVEQSSHDLKLLNGFVPPDLTRPLYANLVEHGRTVCTVDEPACEECDLARFCNYRRNRVAARAKADKPVTMVDLFCGAGGMSTGFSRAGFRTLAAVDSDPYSCRTYELNHLDVIPDTVILGNVTEPSLLDKVAGLVPEDGVDVLVGGPPCQGFSSAGFMSQRSVRARRKDSGIWVEDDDRNYLFEYFVEMAARIRPRTIVMENVPGMDSSRGKRPSFMALAKAMLEALGYNARIWELDAAAYGVPQHRLRKFLVASKAKVAPPLPEPQYRSKIRDLDRFPDLLPPITVMQAIGDLPNVEPDAGEEVSTASYLADESEPSLRHFVTNRRFPIRSGNRVIYNHRARFNNKLDLELFGLLKPGENGLDIISKHQRSDLMRYRRDVFHDKYSRMLPDQPSRTIVSHLSRDGNSYIHPEQVRTITPREGARLQSFPDDYVFCGSQSEQWRQIGNAVPPLLAHAIAGALREHIRRFF
jgi:DNA (cytosine-5)-methyltransferase 1